MIGDVGPCRSVRSWFPIDEFPPLAIPTIFDTRYRRMLAFIYKWFEGNLMVRSRVMANLLKTGQTASHLKKARCGVPISAA